MGSDRSVAFLVRVGSPPGRPVSKRSVLQIDAPCDVNAFVQIRSMNAKNVRRFFFRSHHAHTSKAKFFLQTKIGLRANNGRTDAQFGWWPVRLCRLLVSIVNSCPLFEKGTRRGSTQSCSLSARLRPHSVLQLKGIEHGTARVFCHPRSRCAGNDRTGLPCVALGAIRRRVRPDRDWHGNWETNSNRECRPGGTTMKGSPEPAS